MNFSSKIIQNSVDRISRIQDVSEAQALAELLCTNPLAMQNQAGGIELSVSEFIGIAKHLDEELKQNIKFELKNGYGEILLYHSNHTFEFNFELEAIGVL